MGFYVTVTYVKKFEDYRDISGKILNTLYRIYTFNHLYLSCLIHQQVLL